MTETRSPRVFLLGLLALTSNTVSSWAQAPQEASSQPIRSGITQADAHQLRRAVGAASRIVIGQPEGIEEFGQRYLFHKVRILHNLKGEPMDDVVIRILQVRGVTTHVTPGRSGPRLYCLRPVGIDAGRLGLPADKAPYFRLNGHHGSHPRLAAAAAGNTPESDPVVALIQALVAGEAGATLETTRDRLMALALGPDPIVRFEATMALAERPALHQRLDLVRLSQVMERCAAETDDLVYRIALAELCATRKNPALVEALCLGVGRIKDQTYLQSAGRIAGYVAGEQAADTLGQRIRHVRSDIERGRLMVMLGATGTEAGLKMLLETEKARPDTPMLREALKANGRPKALEAAKRLRARHGERTDAPGDKPTSRPQQGGGNG